MNRNQSHLTVLKTAPPNLKQLLHDTWDRQSASWSDYSEGDSFHRAALSRTEQAVMLSSPRPRATSLVDLGCGSGRFLRQIRKRFQWSRLAGVDYCQPAIDRAIRLDVSGLPRIQFVTRDLELEAQREQTAPLGAFDVAVSTFVVDEIDDIDAFFRTAVSLMEPHGLLICVMLDEARERVRHSLDAFLDSTGSERIIIKQTKTDRYGVDIEYYRIIRPKAEPIRAAAGAGLVCQADLILTPSDLNSRSDGPSLRLLRFSRSLPT